MVNHYESLRKATKIETGTTGYVLANHDEGYVFDRAMISPDWCTEIHVVSSRSSPGHWEANNGQRRVRIIVHRGMKAFTSYDELMEIYKFNGTIYTKRVAPSR